MVVNGGTHTPEGFHAFFRASLQRKIDKHDTLKMLVTDVSVTFVITIRKA